MPYADRVAPQPVVVSLHDQLSGQPDEVQTSQRLDQVGIRVIAAHVEERFLYQDRYHMAARGSVLSVVMLKLDQPRALTPGGAMPGGKPMF